VAEMIEQAKAMQAEMEAQGKDDIKSKLLGEE
jgi:hypothetical protein